MNAIWKMTWVELKLLFRSPLAVGFTVAFPVLLITLFGLIWGNTPNPQFGGLGMVDILAPAYLGLIVATAGLMNLPPALATRRELGVLRRFRATPLSPAVVLGSQIIVNLILAALGAVLTAAAGVLLFKMQLPGDPLVVALGFGLACLSFFALSFIIAGLARTGDAARSIGMALFFPMMMLSGAALPRQIMPEAVQKFSEWLPMTQVVILLTKLWHGGSWNMVSVGALAGMLVVGALISLRTFRWE